MRLVVSNVPPSEAQRIARTLVDERLAACVNVVPGVHSVYRWQGQVEEAEEHTLLIKTTEERRGALVARLAELHPYEVPEIVAFEVPDADVAPSYLAWVRATVA